MPHTTHRPAHNLCQLLLALFVAVSLNVTTAAASAGVKRKLPRRAAARALSSQYGQWELAFSSAPLVHASVLPNGKVLHWTQFQFPPTYTRLWDCVLNANSLCTPTTVSQDVWYNGADLFCSGHSLLPDGRLLITGGTLFNGAFDGTPATTLFDSTNNTFAAGPVMDSGRWYPSNVALGNGETLVAAGTYCTSRDANNVCQTWVNNNVPEVLTASAKRTLSTASYQLPLYPWLHFASNGQVFYSGPTTQSRWLDTQGTGAWTDGPVSSVYRESGSSVMYDADKVLIAGGGTPGPTATAEIIDLNSFEPAWGQTDPMHHPRKHHNLTILADGKVFASGGTTGTGFNNSCPKLAANVPEIWDPATGHWAEMAEMNKRRVYHSTAVLLIDGRVLSGGTTEWEASPAECGPIANEYQTEIFTPPYLFNPDGTLATRPNVSYAPASVTYGQQFFVGGPGLFSTSKVTFVRLSSVTHSINMNQRFNDLGFRPVGGGLRVTAPASSSVCPPGHYMMFVFNGAGVPSVAKIIQIS
jgi:galactose oxidase